MAFSNKVQNCTKMAFSNKVQNCTKKVFSRNCKAATPTLGNLDLIEGPARETWDLIKISGNAGFDFNDLHKPSCGKSLLYKIVRQRFRDIVDMQKI